MGVGSSIYKFVLVLHILSAIVGFGGVILNGFYAQQAKARRGPAGLAVAQANFAVTKIAQRFIYAVFVTGLLVVAMSDGFWDMGETWLSMAMFLYVVGLGISHGAMQPTVRKMLALMESMGVRAPAGATVGGGSTGMPVGGRPTTRGRCARGAGPPGRDAGGRPQPDHRRHPGADGLEALTDPETPHTPRGRSSGRHPRSSTPRARA